MGKIYKWASPSELRNLTLWQARMYASSDDELETVPAESAGAVAAKHGKPWYPGGLSLAGRIKKKQQAEKDKKRAKTKRKKRRRK
jgi:hypothetical protein